MKFSNIYQKVLREDSDFDADVREEAVRVWNLITNAAKNCRIGSPAHWVNWVVENPSGGYDLNPKPRRGEPGFISINIGKAIGEEYYHNGWLFILCPKTGTSGEFQRRGTVPENNPEFAINLFYLPLDFQGNIASIFKKSNPSMFSTFVHEFTHQFDSRRMGKRWDSVAKNSPGPEELGFAHYLNTPIEFNAWYQTSVFEIEQYIKEAEEAFRKWKRDATNTPMMIRVDFRLKVAIVPGNFQAFLKGVDQRIFPLNMLPSLDNRYRKKFISRLSGFYESIEPRLKKLSDEFYALVKKRNAALPDGGTYNNWHLSA